MEQLACTAINASCLPCSVDGIDCPCRLLSRNINEPEPHSCTPDSVCQLILALNRRHRGTARAIPSSMQVRPSTLVCEKKNYAHYTRIEGVQANRNHRRNRKEELLLCNPTLLPNETSFINRWRWNSLCVEVWAKRLKCLKGVGLIQSRSVNPTEGHSSFL